MTEPAAHDRRLVFLFGLSVASKEHHHTAGTHLGITTCRSALDLPVLMQLAQQLGSLAWMTPSANCMVTFLFPLLPRIFTLGYFVVQVCRDLDCLVH